jgi:hypothetical protein
MDRQHAITARYYATLYKDRSTVRVNINREFSTRYTDADIDKMLAAPARKPTDSQPRKRSKYADDPIAPHQAISTIRDGLDPLAIATNAYIAKHGSKIRKALAG